MSLQQQHLDKKGSVMIDSIPEQARHWGAILLPF